MLLQDHNKKSILGFSLVEILVVISIIAVLSSIAMLVYKNIAQNARDQEKIRELNNIKQALELFRSRKQYYPGSLSTFIPNYFPEDTILSIFTYIPSPDDCETKNVCTSYVLCIKKEGSTPEQACDSQDITVFSP